MLIMLYIIISSAQNFDLLCSILCLNFDRFIQVFSNNMMSVVLEYVTILAT